MTPLRWGQVRELFQAALERAPAERQAFLDGACSDDGELRDEVASLLLAHERAGTFIACPTLSGEYGHGNADQDLGAEIAPTRPGMRLGPYEVVRLLGAGGMGEVYLATHLALARPAAIKVLPKGFGRRSRSSLAREAAAAARLQHPCIATFHELLEVDDVVALVMEYVPGPTLRARLGLGTIAVEQTMAVAVCLLEALAHVHAAGLIHRDIKPENIVVTGERSAKLLDFGVATLMLAEAEGTIEAAAAKTRKGNTGIVVGTPGYMSPEQVRGEPLDARSDVFAVGAVLYEMISGRPAFPGLSREARGAAVLSSDPAPLTAAGYPPGLERIVARALHRDPEQRFPSARAFLTELKRTAGASAAAALPDTLAIVDFVDRSADVATAWIGSGLSDSICADLERVDGIRVVPLDRVRRARADSRVTGTDDPVAVGLNLGCRWVLSGSFRVEAGELRVLAELTEVATGRVFLERAYDSPLDRVFETQSRLTRACIGALRGTNAPPPHAQKAPSFSAFEAFSRGRRLRRTLEKGSMDDARDLYERAVAADPMYSPALSELAAVHCLQFTFTTDPRELERGLEYSSRALAADATNADAYVWQGYALSRLDRYEEALVAEQKAMQLDPSDFYPHYFGGLQLLELDRRREALRFFHRAVAVGPDTGICWLALGWTQLCLNLLVEARYSLGKALALEGRSNSFRGVAGYLGDCFRRAKMLDASRVHCLLGLDSVERSDHMYRDTLRAVCLCILGRTAIEQEDRDAAEAAFRQALAQMDGRPRALGGGHLVVQALAGLARAGGGIGAFSEARRLFETREGLNFQYFHATHDDVTLLELARAARAVGRPDDSAALLARARDAGSLEPFDATPR